MVQDDRISVGGDGTIERIRRAARELFAEQGYERTTIREIARRAGITDAAVLYYFRSKRALLTSILEEPTLEPLAPLARWDPGAVADHFLAIFDAYLARADLFRVAVTRALTDDEEIREFNRRLTIDFYNALAPALDQWCEGETSVVMAAATMAFRGLLMDIVVDGEPIDDPAQFAAVRERFRRCILLVLPPERGEHAESLPA